MLYIRWNQDNELGIDIIDEQHRGIVTAINSYFYCVQRGKKRDALKLTKGILDEMTELHFKTEEAFLEEIGYPHRDEHAQVHEKLYRQMNEVYEESLRHHDAEPFLYFLKDWWLTHINEQDRQYADFMQASKTRP